MAKDKKEKIIARCMKEKEQREMTNVKLVVMKNGMQAAKGQCKECGCNMYKILGKAK